MEHRVRGSIGVVGSVVLIGPLEPILRMKRRQLKSKSGPGEGQESAGRGVTCRPVRDTDTLLMVERKVGGTTTPAPFLRAPCIRPFVSEIYLGVLGFLEAGGDDTGRGYTNRFISC